MPSTLLPTAEVADRLGLTVRQVHYLIESDKLRPAMKGNGPRGPMFFDPAEVDLLAADLSAKAAQS
jgi:DNA-binding transcriptional MerR regulator